MAIAERNGRIDLMRGISISLVLFHHFNITYLLKDTGLIHLAGWGFWRSIFRNGNYAVTMFFAISGYLITSNARKRWGSLRDVHALTFYRFRAARIFPCLILLVLSVNLLALSGVGIFQNHSEFGGPVSWWFVDLASLTFWMNVLMGHHGWVNYVLSVQWSLSIEEVFYLTFPIICLLCRRERFLLSAWAIVIVIGPVWRAAHQGSEYLELNSYLSCFDGIAFGCCAAVLARRVQLTPRMAGLICGVVSVLMAWFYLTQWIGHSAIYGVSLMAFGTAVLLVAQSHLPPRTSKLSAPFRFVGRLSYELYLFHLIVLAALQSIWSPDIITGNTKLALLGAYWMLSILLAFLISRFYAEPVNRRLRGSAQGFARRSSMSAIQNPEV